MYEPDFSGSDGLAWWKTNGPNWPSAALNTNDDVLNVSDIAIAPGEFMLHPGPVGEYSIARWIAARAAAVDIESTFAGLSRYPTTTDVHIVHNGVELASAFINVDGAPNSFAYEGTVPVDVGDTIDFAVGYGNGAYDYDSTSLAASICFTSGSGG